MSEVSFYPTLLINAFRGVLVAHLHTGQRRNVFRPFYLLLTHLDLSGPVPTSQSPPFPRFLPIFSNRQLELYNVAMPTTTSCPVLLPVHYVLKMEGDSKLNQPRFLSSPPHTTPPFFFSKDLLNQQQDRSGTALHTQPHNTTHRRQKKQKQYYTTHILTPFCKSLIPLPSLCLSG